MSDELKLEISLKTQLERKFARINKSLREMSSKMSLNSAQI